MCRPYTATPDQSQSYPEEPQLPPRPRRVPGLGRRFPPYPSPPPLALPLLYGRYLYLLRTLARLSLAAGSTCLPDRPQQHPSTLPGRLLLFPTRYSLLLAVLFALHSFIRACCRRPPIPHSLLCTFQSNPIQPAVLSFYRPPIPARTSCRASIVSQTLFSSPCAALRAQHPIDCQSSYCPTFCQTSPSGTGDPPAQSSPALPTLRMRDNIKLSPPVIRSSSNQPRPQSTISLKHY